MIGKRFLQFLLSIFLACTVFVQHPAAVRAEGGSFEVVCALQDDHVKAEKDGTARLEVTVNSWDDLDSADISLQWYLASYSPDGMELMALEGETNPVLLLSNVTSEDEYHCVGTDSLGNQSEAVFYVRRWTSFDSSLEGETNRTVAPGSSETIHINVESESPVTFTWSRQYKDFDPESQSIQVISETIDNETDTLVLENIARTEQIYVHIQGDESDEWYCVDIDVENHLEIDQYPYYFPVGLGETANLFVNTAADDLTDVQYYWYRVDTETYKETYIENVNGSTYTTSPVNSEQLYRVYVIDKYKNEENITLSAFPENNFSVSARGDTFLQLKPGDSVELGVDVSCNDSSKVSYYWELMIDSEGADLERIDGAVSDTYIFENFQKKCQIRCVVNDGYGNTDSVTFYLNYDNNFHSYQESTDIYVPYGESTTLHVITEGDDLSKATYNWEYNGNTITNNSDTFTIEGVTTFSIVNCQIFDGYGNEAYLTFYVHVENNFSAYPVQENLKSNRETMRRWRCQSLRMIHRI